LAFVASAFSAEIDLDKPGALEALKRDRPAHYERVMKEVAEAQAIEVDSAARPRDTRMDDRSKGTGPVLPSDPAKRRVTVYVDDFTYKITALLTKDPAKLEKAK